jgi:integrase
VPEIERLLTDIGAGELLGLHPKTVQRMACCGEIPAIRIGRYWRFRPSDLNSWLDSLATARKKPCFSVLESERQPVRVNPKKRKAIVGIFEKFRKRADAMRACELLRAKINRETRSPHTVAELITHFTEKELPNKTPYTGQVYAGYLKRWILPGLGEHSLSDVKAVAVEGWLKTLPLAPGTRAKLRNLMHAIFNHGIRWEFFDRNPITLVRQSAKRIRVPEVLAPEEIGKLLSELPEVWRTAVYIAITTGLRVSELRGLKREDVDFTTGEIHLSRGVVRRFIRNMKTEDSRKPVPMEGKLADVLAQWREICPYNQDEDFIFASPKKRGKQPYWPSAAMEDHIQPAARRAGIQNASVGIRCATMPNPGLCRIELVETRESGTNRYLTHFAVRHDAA